MSINPPRVDLDKMETNLSYLNLLGVKSWSKLHPDIQQRFGLNAKQAVTYKGVMKHVKASRMGRLFAQICQLIGTPLALHTGENVPVEVNVYPSKSKNGMNWDRFYSFEKQPVNRVKSTKCLLPEGGLVELVGAGFGMKLEVSERGGALCFESTEFFWQYKNFKLTIPDVLSPGKTLVSQKALANGQFEFSLQVEHLWLGRVFEQVGVFKAYAKQN